MFYYLSIGSNISPLKNFEKVIVWLAENFECVVIFPPKETQPEDLATKNVFVNGLAIIYSELDEMAVKAQLNQLEEMLGRDRNDPECGAKDRPADLDIMEKSTEYNPDLFSNYNEGYIQKVFKLQGDVAQICIGNTPLDNKPATVYMDRASGQIRLVKDKLDGLNEWLKTGSLAE